MGARLIDALAIAALAVVAFIALGGAMTAVAGPFHPRGDFVDIGGRKLRIVCDGPPAAQPLIVMESGAFGLAADFGAVQQKLAAKGLRSCAYDRAGMGWSDPGPRPRDTLAVVKDLEALLAARGETGPFVLVGHSMAGLHLRTFAGRNPDKIVGLVLVEAAVPAPQLSAFERRFLPAFVTISRAGAVLGSLGLLKPFIGKGDRIGLPPEASAEKRRAFVTGRHARTAAHEVVNWRRSVNEAIALPPFRPEWPVAVVLAGDRFPEMNAARAKPAQESLHGRFEAVPGASHTTVLGLTYGDAVVRGVEHVLAHSAVAAAAPAP